ncbi:MAG: hypothetical protein AMXMBFR84_22530 [Candidatus Hydrogenedentota bacterium]
MLGKIHTILWEQCRNTISGLAVIAAIMAVYGLMLYFVLDLTMRIFARSDSLTFSVAYLPLLGATAILFLNENRNVIRFDYPRRMFIHPVRTWVLVSTQMGYKLAALLMLTLASGLMCRYLIYPEFVFWPQLFAAAIWVTMLQAVVFLAMAFGGGTGIVIGLGIALLTSPLAAIVFGAAGSTLSIRREPELFVLPVTSISMAGCSLVGVWWATAVMAARRARNEVPEDRVGFWMRTAGTIARFERPEHDFASKEAAQRWYEWRRGTYLYPWVSVAAGLILSVAMNSSLTGMHLRFQFLLIMLGLAPGAVACLMGYLLTRQDAMYDWFVGAKPIANRSIGAARIAASVKALAIGYAMLIVTYVLGHWILFPDSPLHPTVVSDLRETTVTEGSYADGLLMLGFYAFTVLLAVWSIFWLGRVAGVAIWLAGFAAAVHYYRVGQLYDVQGGDTSSPVISTFAIALTAVAFVGLVGSYGVALWRGILTAAKAGAALLAALVLASCALYFRGYIPLENSWLVAFWFMVPLAPFAALPLTIAWQRNR